MSYRSSAATIRLILAGWVLGQAALVAAGEPEIRTFVERHCTECHGEDVQEAGFRLDTLQFKLDDPDLLQTWVKVHDRIDRGEMPPKEMPRPPADEQKRLLKVLAGDLRKADLAQQRDCGRAGLRRLNRCEYGHTLSDLLARPNLDFTSVLPPDRLAYGYDKSAEALDFSHVQIASYLEAADLGLRAALAPCREQPPVRTLRVSAAESGTDAGLKLAGGIRMIGEETSEVGRTETPPPEWKAVGVLTHQSHSIEKLRAAYPGHYRLRVRAFGFERDAEDVGRSRRTEAVSFSAGGRSLGTVDIPPGPPSTAELTVWLEADESIAVAAASLPFAELPDAPDADEAPAEPSAPLTTPGVAFQWLELEGPVYDQWPPESHRRLFGSLPLESIAATGEKRPVCAPGIDYTVFSPNPKADARELLRSFAGRAWRRPVGDADIAEALAIAREKLEKDEPFLDAMIAAYRAVLCSPEFLLLGCPRATGAPSETAVNASAGHEFLSTQALASRLAYFLWCSPPDDELLARASDGTLAEPAVLRRQVERMLADPRSERFVSHFLDHWLGLSWINVTEPDENLYPEFTPLLLQACLAETRGYFAEMLRRNLGARYLVDSEFAMLNQRLAEHYGVPGVQGNAMRPVKLPPDSVRGGLLTQASILKVTSNGTTTSPVARGVFVLSTILGAPVPPPPESIPSVEPDLSGTTTIREQFAKHRAEESCAVCHQRIDPPGFVLESFDVIGGWRERYRSLEQGATPDALDARGLPVSYKLGQPVDPSGELPDGRAFSDIREFRKLLLSKEKEIAQNLLEQLVVYSTGAPVSFADREVVDEILEKTRQSGYGTRSMIHELVQSRLFRKP